MDVKAALDDILGLAREEYQKPNALLIIESFVAVSLRFFRDVGGC